MEEFSGSTDQTIVKGKRTKRPRPTSSTSSTGGGCVVISGGGDGGGGDFYNNNSVLVSSPTCTSNSGISTSTEEDEDMANCLILLARGGSPRQPGVEAKAATPPENKFTSRKLAEMPITGNGKVGIFVYECKTCNRTFPSFQALGGHRASHKRPKPNNDVIDKKTSSLAPPPPPQEVQEHDETAKVSVTVSPPPSVQLGGKSSFNNKSSKIHECSICGSEFGSGQALGGHMRRHRAAPSITTNTRISTSIDNDTASHDVSDKARNILELDLNLPAPPEEENFHPYPSKKPPRLVFSAAAQLVDCHY